MQQHISLYTEVGEQAGESSIYVHKSAASNQTVVKEKLQPNNQTNKQKRYGPPRGLRGAMRQDLIENIDQGVPISEAMNPW
jgi:hypothetical protein